MNERQLKFRIYSYTDKLWHYFDIYEYPQDIYGAVTSPQQFTGLTDKVGKEIYEGDIVELPYIHQHSGALGVVIFQYAAFMVRGLPGSIAGIFQDSYVIFKDGEVVGNIIENPELLK